MRLVGDLFGSRLFHHIKSRTYKLISLKFFVYKCFDDFFPICCGWIRIQEKNADPGPKLSCQVSTIYKQTNCILPLQVPKHVNIFLGTIASYVTYLVTL